MYQIMKSNTGEGLIKHWTEGVTLEEEAVQQIKNVADLPFIYKHVAIMPDAHWGIGATVGSVIATQKAVIPAAVGVDIGCFSGDTEIALTDGSNVKIKDLIEVESFHVYAYDRNDKLVKTAKATASLTRKNQHLMSVKLESDIEIVCTSDHQFLLKNGSYRKAEKLNTNQYILCFHQEENEDGMTCQHRVISIKALDRIEDVYCLTVPTYHNFALACGAFVHNCGMIAAQTNLVASDLPDTLKDIRHSIERGIPVGQNDFQHVPAHIEEVFKNELEDGYKSIVAKHSGIQLGRGKSPAQSLSTLGGGNHFCELCLDSDQRVWIMLHSGSRGIGNRIGRYFIDQAKSLMAQYFVHLPHPDLAYFPEHTQFFDDYVEAVGWAQKYAYLNRQQMLNTVLKSLNHSLKREVVTTEEVVNCHHNYISREHHFGQNVLVTRKGAVSAKLGEMGIIPGSMGAKSFIVRGLGNPESFHSCSHGAGRQMSRKKAKDVFTVDDILKQTEGVECKKDESVLDEIPGAYKSIEQVMLAQIDLVEPVYVLKQIMCIKG